MADLERGENIILEGRAGCGTSIDRGMLTLTDRRLIFERRFSIDPFEQQELVFDLDKIRSATSDGDAIVLDVDGKEITLFVQWWMLSLLTDSRKTKTWLREINAAREKVAGKA